MSGPVTIYEVAERAGVSIATVSRVVRGSTPVSAASRTKVEQAMRELRYVPTSAARSLAVRRQEAYGLVLPELDGPYYSELLMGFEGRAAELGQSVLLVLASATRDVQLAMTRLATRADALAVLGHAALVQDEVLEAAGDKPLVLIAGDPEQNRTDVVATEGRTTAVELTEHLLDHGRTSLRYLGDPAASADFAERYAGFCSAHEARGLQPAPAAAAGFREADGAAYAQELIADHAAGRPVPDALVCANDLLALAAMHTLQDAGFAVPDDIAVVGWDDVMTARYVRPGLTTVNQSVRHLGEAAATRLHERVSEDASARTRIQTLPSHLVIRGSCGCPDESAIVRPH